MQEPRKDRVNQEPAQSVDIRRKFREALLRLDAEWCVCIGTTLVAVCLHFVRLFHAGRLWRDEAGLVLLATLPSLSELWQKLTHDSFPVLFPIIIRIWSGLGLGDSDLELRVLP